MMSGYTCSSSLLCLLLLTSAAGSSAQIIYVRLVGGLSSYQGRVEVYTVEHGWGTVCDEDWSINEARVVCRQLGYPGATEAHRDAHFGQGSGSFYINDFECSGSESDLSDCLVGDSWPVWSCDHGDDVSVTCIVETDAGVISDVRLVGGSSRYEGRVEVYSDEHGWGTVCDDNWSMNEARVVCRQLGYPAVDTEAHRNAHFGQGSGTLFIDDFECSGSESDLSDCLVGDSWPEWSCDHGDDVSVTCGVETDTGTISDVRLVGGLRSYQGRVEVYSDEHGWGTVCDEDWSINEARVVCRQLGYPDASEAHRDAHFGQGSGTLFIDDFECSGSDSDLSDCLRGDSWPEWSCDHGDDVSVTCGLDLDVRLVNGDKHRGRVEISNTRGIWGTICDEDWSLDEARVVCRQLGYYSAIDAPKNAYFGRGSGPVYLDYFDCDGDESNIGYCLNGRTWPHSQCSHDDDVGVICGAAGISTAVGIILGGLAAFIILR